MDFSQFHFIRPYWLLAVFVLFIAMWLLKRLRISQSGWTKLIPQHLSKILIDGRGQSQSFSLIWPFVIGLLSIIALAGPTWQKLPQPVYQIKRGAVIVMDMSYSMYATDLVPNRLTRSRFKAVDLLDSLNEGDIGLIAYAGDAFIISPLTQDINNIKLLLPSLSPELMPEVGSNPLAALDLANQMLTNAGHIEGDIYWFTDGIDREDVKDISDWQKSYSHKLNILGVGTQDGAPIKLPNGELLKDDNGAIVLPRLPIRFLSGIAQNSKGVYRTVSHENSDIEALLKSIQIEQEQQESSNMNSGDQWQEAGPYLVVLLLPLLLGYFRRGVLVVLPISLLLLPQEKAYALDWQDLWKTKDQQGQQAFNNEHFEQAAKQFQRKDWSGSAHYRAGNYEAALDAFKQSGTAEALYNQGNALAKLQRLDEAIKAYEEALKLDADFEDAAKNKEIIESLKQQQDQQKQDGDSGDEGQENQENQEQNDVQKSQDSSNQSQDGEQNQEQEQSESEQDSGQSQDQSNQQQDSEPQQQEQSESQNEQQNQDSNEQEQQDKANADSVEQSQEQEEQDQTAKAQQLRQEQIDQEKAQKHQQLMNKVTDDPYLLLRNKMQLEYQKRRQQGTQSGAKKKW